MIGAIAGDIIGSVFEGKVAWQSARTPHFRPLFHPKARFTAAAVFLARTGRDKEQIRDSIGRRFGYRLDARIDDIRPTFPFDVSCRGTVPPAILAFLESTDYESAVRLAVSLGGDSDTITCMAGGIAQAYYGGVPAEIRDLALGRLDEHLRSVVAEFEARFPHPPPPSIATNL